METSEAQASKGNEQKPKYTIPTAVNYKTIIRDQSKLQTTKFKGNRIEITPEMVHVFKSYRRSSVHDMETQSLVPDEVNHFSPIFAPPHQLAHTPLFQRDSSIQRVFPDEERVDSQYSKQRKDESYVQLPQIKDNLLESQMSQHLQYDYFSAQFTNQVFKDKFKMKGSRNMLENSMRHLSQGQMANRRRSSLGDTPQYPDHFQQNSVSMSNQFSTYDAESRLGDQLKNVRINITVSGQNTKNKSKKVAIKKYNEVKEDENQKNSLFQQVLVQETENDDHQAKQARIMKITDRLQRLSEKHRKMLSSSDNNQDSIYQVNHLAMAEIHQKIKELKLTREEQQRMIERGYQKLFEVFEQLDSSKEPSKLISPKLSPKVADNSTYGGSIQFASKEEFVPDIEKDSQAMPRDQSQLERKVASDLGQSILPELYEKPLKQQIEDSKLRSKSTKRGPTQLFDQNHKKFINAMYNPKNEIYAKPSSKSRQNQYVGFQSKMTNYNEKLEIEQDIQNKIHIDVYNKNKLLEKQKVDKELEEIVERRKHEILTRKQEMKEMFETPIRMKAHKTNPFVVQHMNDRDKSGFNNKSFREFADDNDYTIKRKAHLYKLQQIKERENKLQLVKNHQYNKKKEMKNKVHRWNYLKTSDTESENSVHRPYSGGKLGNQEFQKFNKKFFKEKKEKVFETVVKTLSNDQHIIGEILLHDVAVDANPKLLKEPAPKSKWTALRGLNKNDHIELENKGLEIMVGLNVKSDKFEEYQKQLQLAKNQVVKLSNDFDNYVANQERRLSYAQIDKLPDILKYNQIFKDGHKQITQEQMQLDPKFQFFMQTEKDQGLNLPILSYVADKTLSLINYNMSITHCRALSASFKYFQEFINRIVLDNCGVDDEEFAEMIEGIKDLKDFKKIIYKRNRLSYKSIEGLKHLVSRRIPNHLDVLRIENCKLEPTVSLQLIKLLGQRNSLKTLGLVNFQLTDETFQILVNSLEHAEYLRELDISWNHIKHNSFSKLFTQLENNQQLVYLNLSYNILFEDIRDYKEVVKFKTVKLKSGKEKKVKVVEKDDFIYTEFDEEKDQTMVFNEPLSRNTKRALENLCRFIRRNTVLNHVDLSHCGMNEQMLWYFGRTLRRSKSIRGCHLSGNPGITERLIDYLKNRMHCKTENPVRNYIPLGMLPSQIKMREDRELGMQRQLVGDMMEKYNWQDKKEKAKQVLKQKEDRLNQGRQDIVIAKNIKNQKEAEQTATPKYAAKKDYLIFTRMIGRKRDLPGMGQWRCITQQPPGENDCWISDRQIYSLIFWNALIGKSVQMQIPEEDREYILDKIRQFDKIPDPVQKYPPLKTFKPIHLNPILESYKVDYDLTTAPEIYGTFTNWRPKRMYDIREFCHRVDRRRPNIFKMMQDSGLLDKNADSVDDLKLDIEKEEYNHEMAKYYKDYISIWKDVIQDSLPYKEPNLVNAKFTAMIENQDAPLYVYPCFMKTQKRYYAIKVKKKRLIQNMKTFKKGLTKRMTMMLDKVQKDKVQEMAKLLPKKQMEQKDSTSDVSSDSNDQEIVDEASKEKTPNQSPIKNQEPDSKYEWFVHSTMCDFRREDLPIFNKSYDEKITYRVFKKESSVFAQWKQDDVYIIGKCLEHDEQYWKIHKFIKDKEDYNNVVAYYKKNFNIFAGTYKYLSARGRYPFVNFNDFTWFSRKANMPDKFLTQNIIDQLFIAVNVNLDMIEQEQNNMRELNRFELYELFVRIAKDKYLKKQGCETFADAIKMLTEKNVIPYSGYKELQNWREEELWVIEVNDILQINQETIRAVYKQHVKSPNNKLTKDDVIELYTKNEEIKMAEQDVVFCYGLSKMTIPNENTDSQKYEKIEFVEFLEFLCRVAVKKFEGSELEHLTVAEKLVFILKDLFEQHDLKYTEKEQEDDIETESDQDY